MHYNVDCPGCDNSIRVQVWKEGECPHCKTEYDWGDDGDAEPEIYFNENIAVNDNTEADIAA